MKIRLLILLFALSLVANAENTYTSTSLLSSGKWVKIRVKDEGVYQLTPGSLKSMGFANANNVRLYGYNLPVLPETNIQNLSDDLVEIPLYHADSGALLFYSKGLTDWKRTKSESPEFVHANNPYSKYVYYFLTEDANVKPAEFKKVDAKTTEKPTQSTYYKHVIHESDDYSFLNCGRTFFESYDFGTGSIRSYNLDLGNSIPTGDIALSLQFGAAGNNSSTLSVSSDKTNLGSMTFSRLGDYQYASVVKKDFTVRNIITNKLSLTLGHNRQSGTTGHLDYIQACFETTLDLTVGHVAFTPNKNGNVVFGIKNFDNTKLTLWNVTSPSKTYELEGTTTGENSQLGTSTVAGQYYNAKVEDANISDLYVVLDKTATYPSPDVVGTIANQNLHGLKDINLLIIVPSNGKLTAQAQRLADAHTQKDGLKCAVVTAEQVYNEFSSGTPDVTAYRRLAKMLYDRDGSLQNILLFGACYWDNRFITPGFSSKNPDDYLLVWESINSWSHTDSYVCEEYITLLDDEEGVSPLKEKPDAGVGRIPVSTEKEAKGVVDKLISYINNDHVGAWKNTICFMGDDGAEKDGDANVHMKDAEAVISSTIEAYPDYRYKRIYWDSYERKQSATGNSYPDAHNEIEHTIEEGALIMNYTGHGAAYILSHEQVLKTEDFQRWNSPRLPLWLTAACDVCPFDMNTENIACEALLNPNGAAMGVISTARTVYSSANRVINRNFMKHVLETTSNGERYTIGEALALAKCDIIGSKTTYMSRIDSLNKAHYVLIGDPAIRLLTPKYKVQIDSISGAQDESETPVLSAGSRVTINGHIVDEDGNLATNYSGVVYPTILDTEELIVCKNNSGLADDPFTYRDRQRTLYSGSDSIKSGTFSFTFSMPVDLNYGDETGMMKIYAVNDKHDIEAHGSYQNFYVGGEGDVAFTDTIGPSIHMVLNTSAFRNGMHVGKNSTLYALLSDSSGINTTGNGIGHDIVAIVDGKESTTFTLNNYYKQNVGDYTSGTITYNLENLEVGAHTLTLRAFDIYNNASTATITFYVYDGEETAEIFDMSGRKFSPSFTTVLPPGVYIRRLTYTKDGKVTEERTEKFYVTQ